MRAAAMALPFESPKLIATAVFSREEFAEKLEKTITRTRIALIEAKSAK
jgi:hypothetical protein